ncbi:MAG: hypothetical protein JRH20_30970, partial [Deltaproteobacteria bacterium]|nr:hypothetical protein [Deltaproteobacteria bacterium]
STIWDSNLRRSEFQAERVERLAIMGEGVEFSLPEAAHGLSYACLSLPTRDPAALVQHLQTRMRQVEGELSKALAADGFFVVSDGPIQPLAPHQVIGYIKRQMAPYLPPELTPVVGALQRAERTPLFCFGARYPRYSWYIRLTALNGGHAWSGVARCECTATLPLAQVQEMANMTASLLPRFASSAHIDPRAPQNLVPIGALEKHLRRLLGDASLVHRALRSSMASLESSI